MVIDMRTMEFDGVEYNVFTDEEREEYMRDYVEDNFEYFNDWFIFNCLDSDRVRDFFEETYSDWNSGYAHDIETESASDTEFDNRLEEEMHERGVDNIDDFIEDMTEDQLNEGLDGFQHYIDNFGREQAMQLLKDHSHLIDFDEMAEDAVRNDGYGHFLNSYDGEEIEFEFDGETYYAYRT